MATCTTSSLSVGQHAITAYYSGNNLYAGSQSLTILLTVVKPSTVDAGNGSTSGGGGGSGPGILAMLLPLLLGRRRRRSAKTS